MVGTYGGTLIHLISVAREIVISMRALHVLMKFPLFHFTNISIKMMCSMIGNQSDQLMSLRGQVTMLRLENETLKEQLQVCILNI